MGKKVIRVNLFKDGVNGIDGAIYDLIVYKREFLKKVETYRKRMADELANIASLNFGSATMEHTVRGVTRKPNVKVSVSERGSISVVVADGEDAVWCEFGAGVYYNGSVGSSPNPYGKDLGFTIGSYGKGYGKGKAWGYYDETGELVITRGTPATMPMYNAAREITRKAISIAREVFGT